MFIATSASALIMLALGKDVLSTTNPYRGSRTQIGDITLGSKNVLSMLAQAALRNEIDKLANNIGRDAAGVHYRSSAAKADRQSKDQHCSDATRLNRESILVQKPAASRREIKGITCRPYDIGYPAEL